MPGFPVSQPCLVFGHRIADPNLFIEVCKKPGPELQHDLDLGITVMAADAGCVLKISLNEYYCHTWTLKKNVKKNEKKPDIPYLRFCNKK